jgi:hypothetical protein
MQNLLQKNHRLLFFTGWCLINIIQATGTELLDDEAYYWLYSRFLDWGYFDHPPMVAALIKAGFAIFPNELGVRFFMILLNTATIFIVHLLTNKKDDRLFYAVATTVVVAQIGGMLAAPDTPLLFFVALFFWLYQRFLQKMNFTNALLLGICMACMLYSKYHGILVIGFTLLSNPKLFVKPYAYLAAIICLLLFMPHLYWQYTHNFPSVQYHLFERNPPFYKFSFTTEYIIGQIAFAGPVMGWFLLWGAFKYQPVSDSERALKYSVVGIYAAFLVSTLKGRVEANWTVAAFIPLMVLSHRYLVQNYQLQKWLYRSIPFTLLLMLFARLYLMWWSPQISWIKRNEFHGNRVWTNDTHQKAGPLPVVYADSYQMASKYWFYTGVPSFSINSPFYRRNNFNLWPVEDSLIGKPVYMDLPGESEYYTHVFKPHGWAFPQDGIRKNFFSFSRVLFTGINSFILQERTIQLNTKVATPAHYIPLFQQSLYRNTPLWLVLYQHNDIKSFVNTGATVQQLTGTNLRLTVNLSYTLPPGDYTARLCIGTCVQGFPTINSTEFAFNIQ